MCDGPGEARHVSYEHYLTAPWTAGAKRQTVGVSEPRVAKAQSSRQYRLGYPAVTKIVHIDQVYPFMLWHDLDSSYLVVSI
jgi:hypothetical protein